MVSPETPAFDPHYVGSFTFFGGDHAHKAFALALGLQLLVDSFVAEPGYGAVLLVARPEADPVPALRVRAAGVRLPGQS